RYYTLIIILLIRRSPSATLFPYTTLFRSRDPSAVVVARRGDPVERDRPGCFEPGRDIARRGEVEGAARWRARRVAGGGGGVGCRGGHSVRGRAASSRAAGVRVVGVPGRRAPGDDQQGGGEGSGRRAGPRRRGRWVRAPPPRPGPRHRGLCGLHGTSVEGAADGGPRKRDMRNM